MWYLKTTIKSFKIINSTLKFHISHDDGTMHVASATDQVQLYLVLRQLKVNGEQLTKA